MRAGGNFHAEWGYLAPAPSLMRTARIVVVATAIGATAGAAVVVSLAGSSGTGGVAAAGEKSLVVVHSFVQPAEAAPVVAQQAAPPDVTAPVIVPSPPPAAASANPNVNLQASVQPAKGNLMPLPPTTQISPPAASKSRSVSTPAVPASVAALAEIPPTTDASAVSAASQVTFAPDQTGAARDGGRKPRGADLAQQRGPQVAAATAKKRPDEPRGLGPLLRHLFSARAGSSYYPN